MLDRVTPVPLRLDRIQSWLGPRIVGVERRTPLSGGQTSPAVERITLLAGNGTVDVVAKRATPGELAAMEVLDVVDPVFPQLLDSGNDRAGPWIVTWFYPGDPLDWSAECPPAVYEALARLHQRYLGADLSPDLPRVDDAFLRSTFAGFARNGILQAGPTPVRDRALELLDRFAEDERLRAALDILPATLLHGDVYGSNVISGERLVLIDWGSARVGPAMLDVMLAAGPRGLDAYRQATPDDPHFAIGRAWATAVNNAMFVGDVAVRSPDVAAAMLDQAERAIDELGKQLT
jgi:hypothetical protein